MSENDRPDFTKQLYLPEIVSRSASTTLDGQIRLQLARTLETMIGKFATDETLLRRIKMILERIYAEPENADDHIRRLLQFEISQAIKETTANLLSPDALSPGKGLDMNQVMNLAVPIVSSISAQAISNGMAIKSLVESFLDLTKTIAVLSPIPQFDAKYLKDNIANFIKEAHDTGSTFSMVAIKNINKEKPLTPNSENRLIAFMEMVLRQKKHRVGNIELVAMENGYFILLFINSTAQTACLCAWNINEEIQRAFDEQLAVAVSSYDPEVYKKILPQQHEVLQVHKLLPAMYGLTLLRMLDYGTTLSKSLPKDQRSIVFQCKPVFSEQAFVRDGTQYMIGQSGTDFNRILTTISPKTKPTEIKTERMTSERSIEPETSPSEKPSSIRKVYFAEESYAPEASGPITERREVPFKGLRESENPNGNDPKK